MNRIEKTFSCLAQDKKKGLVVYLMAGHPSPEATLPLMHACVEAGADVIELGIPFSDPIADGPIIAEAAQKALLQGMNQEKALELALQFRAQDPKTPIVVMGYLNPVEAMGMERFALRAASSGVDGVLLVDLSAEESSGYLPVLAKNGLFLIFLVSPTTSRTRMQKIASLAQGFIYYVSLKGVTGASGVSPKEVCAHVEALRGISSLPIAVGFGIRGKEEARAIASCADAIVVGSQIVALAEKGRQEVFDFVRGLRRVLDGKEK